MTFLSSSIAVVVMFLLPMIDVCILSSLSKNDSYLYTYETYVYFFRSQRRQVIDSL